jgi:hypothetical protein
MATLKAHFCNLPFSDEQRTAEWKEVKNVLNAVVSHLSVLCMKVCGDRSYRPVPVVKASYEQTVWTLTCTAEVLLRFPMT